VSKNNQQHKNAEIPADCVSLENLAERYLGLVIPIARHFQKRLPPRVDFDDLVGAGNLGLVEAARRYNPARGTSFDTFARHRIRGAIGDSLRRIDHVSRYLRGQQKAAEQATAELMTILGRNPTEAEVAERLHVPLQRWRRLRRELHEAGCPVNGPPMHRLPAPSDPARLPCNHENPEQMAMISEVHRVLLRAIGTLPARYQQVIQLYDFQELTMEQIGITLGVDQSRVSQIRTAALARLRVLLAPWFSELR
jgi:RNA polymerase sigma factor FliA